MAKRRGTVHGVLIVNKPVGPTSHDIVAQARRVFGTRAVGHAGTLDPLASGVLVLMFGDAARLAAYLTSKNKAYQTTIQFGVGTDSLDAQGSIVARTDVPSGWLTRDRLQRPLAIEATRTRQVPPAFSAIRVNGQRAHRLARAGRAPELSDREVKVEAIELTDVDGPRATFRLVVSKGYYVRSFGRDVGLTLGVPAHVASLSRLASDPFELREAVDWPPDAQTPPQLIPTVTAATRALGRAVLSPEGAQRAIHGQLCDAACFAEIPSADGSVQAWVDQRGRLVALGAATADDSYRVVRGFPTPQRTSSDATDSPRAANLDSNAERQA